MKKVKLDMSEYNNNEIQGENSSGLKSRLQSKLGVGVIAFIAGAVLMSFGSPKGSPEPSPTITVAGPTVTVSADPLPAVTVTAGTSQGSAPNQRIEEGVWTVGLDVQPGTYRVETPITSEMSCYWKISKTGTNGSDII